MRHMLFILLLIVSLGGCEQQPPGTIPSPGTPTQRVQSPAESEPRIGGAGVSFEDIPGATAETTRNFLIILDQSESMSDGVSRTEAAEYFAAAQIQPEAGVSRMNVAKLALRQFVSEAPADVNLGLAIFGSRGIEILVPLGRDNRGQLQAAITGIRLWNGGTPLGEAIVAGTDRLMDRYKQQLGYGEYRLVVVTDGENNGKVSVSEAGAYAHRFGMPIYTIGFTVRGRHQLQDHSFWYKPASGVGELKDSLRETLVESPDPFDTIEPSVK